MIYYRDLEIEVKIFGFNMKYVSVSLQNSYIFWPFLSKYKRFEIFLIEIV